MNRETFLGELQVHVSTCVGQWTGLPTGSRFKSERRRTSHPHGLKLGQKRLPAIMLTTLLSSMLKGYRKNVTSIIFPFVLHDVGSVLLLLSLVNKPKQTEKNLMFPLVVWKYCMLS